MKVLFLLNSFPKLSETFILNQITCLLNSNKDIKSYLSRSDIFILPSVTSNDGNMEGIPIVLMEAMASGVRVISTYHSGIPELIHHCETGILCEEKNYDELANNIYDLAENYNKRINLSSKARKFVVQNHNINS